MFMFYSISSKDAKPAAKDSKGVCAQLYLVTLSFVYLSNPIVSQESQAKVSYKVEN